MRAQAGTPSIGSEPLTRPRLLEPGELTINGSDCRAFLAKLAGPQLRKASPSRPAAERPRRPFASTMSHRHRKGRDGQRCARRSWRPGKRCVRAMAIATSRGRSRHPRGPGRLNKPQDRSGPSGALTTAPPTASKAGPPSRRQHHDAHGDCATTNCSLGERRLESPTASQSRQALAPTDLEENRIKDHALGP